jgi:DNA-binding NtrC family response regulator
LNNSKGHILVIDDEADIRESLFDLLSLYDYQISMAVNATEGLEKAESGHYDLILLDLSLPDGTGLDLLTTFQQRGIDTPVFMITAYGSIEVAVEALKRGAADYFSKPWDNEKLVIEIERMISKRRLERENQELKRALKQRYSFPNIVGKSDAMLRVLDLVAQVAPSRATILVTGETGTGKELIAKAIHANSPRADDAFVAVNSGSVPPDLLETSLFGHVKGSFTGAIATKKGYFEAANRGTIFFDEIGTISLETQAKLLRVIQEKEFMPVGSNETIRVDVRILAATNADLRRLDEEGKFREDLYYRLNVINIVLPPLRDRKQDIPSLASHFFTKYCKENDKPFLVNFDPEAMQLLMEYNWPGNVRELENVVERAVVLASNSTVSAEVFPDQLLTRAACAYAATKAGTCHPMPRCLKWSRISSAGKFSRRWSSAITARQKRLKSCASRCPRSIRKSRD